MWNYPKIATGMVYGTGFTTWFAEFLQSLPCKPTLAKLGCQERDYFPYWHPTPWHDIAVLTEEPQERCAYAKWWGMCWQNSQPLTKNYFSTGNSETTGFACRRFQKVGALFPAPLMQWTRGGLALFSQTIWEEQRFAPFPCSFTKGACRLGRNEVGKFTQLETLDRGEYYRTESQNVQDKGYCTLPQYNNPTACVANAGVSWQALIRMLWRNGWKTRIFRDGCLNHQTSISAVQSLLRSGRCKRRLTSPLRTAPEAPCCQFVAASCFCIWKARNLQPGQPQWQRQEWSTALLCASTTHPDNTPNDRLDIPWGNDFTWQVLVWQFQPIRGMFFFHWLVDYTHNRGLSPFNNQ